MFEGSMEFVAKKNWKGRLVRRLIEKRWRPEAWARQTGKGETSLQQEGKGNI